MSHTPEEVRKHVRVYLSVFGALLVATVVTVAVSYVHLYIALAVLVALVIATAKASLVAAFFMHLKGESGQIYRILMLTAIFLIALFALPFMGKFSTIDTGNRLWTARPAPAHTEAAPH
jgi:cytochrome c oxidase subunit 4